MNSYTLPEISLFIESKRKVFNKNNISIKYNGSIDENVMKSFSKSINIPSNYANENAEIKLKLYVLQDGKDVITNEPLGDRSCFSKHHITPRSMGGNDNIENLCLVNNSIHKIIHMSLNKLLYDVPSYNLVKSLTNLQIARLNQYRVAASNLKIPVDIL